MNLKKGFQRIAWVIVAIAAPIIGFVVYQLSEHTAGYVPRLVASDSTVNRQTSKVVLMDNVGVVYFPSYLSDADVEERMRAVYDRAEATNLPDASRRRSISEFAAAVRSKYPEYADLDNTDLVHRVVTKFPVYRSEVNFREFEIDTVREKRSLWAVGVTLAVLAVLAGVLFGSIAVVTWIAKGFGDSP